MPVMDAQMPREWHTIKSVLLTEMRTADTFQHCIDVADALFHARLLGQTIYRTCNESEDRAPCYTEKENGTPSWLDDGSGPPCSTTTNRSEQ
jgi:hypothetical protein